MSFKSCGREGCKDTWLTAVYILGRMGSTREALTLIMTKLGDIEQGRNENMMSDHKSWLCRMANNLMTRSKGARLDGNVRSVTCTRSPPLDPLWTPSGPPLDPNVHNVGN
eukprot:7021758-Pyramimonas_sp.AAC.1